MDSFLLNIETEFFFFTGTYLEGFLGLILGLTLFCFIIQILRFEWCQDPDLKETHTQKYAKNYQIHPQNPVK